MSAEPPVLWQDADGVIYRIGDDVYLHGQSLDEDSSDDEDADVCNKCRKCTQPSETDPGQGKLVECDGCGGNYHMLCVGLAPDIEPPEVWLCGECEQGLAPTRPLNRRDLKFLFGPINSKASGPRHAIYTLGRIVGFKSGGKKFLAQRYCLPREADAAPAAAGAAHHMREVFQEVSNGVPWVCTYDLTNIAGHAEVVPRAGLGALNGLDDVFVCDYSYDLARKTLHAMADPQLQDPANSTGGVGAGAMALDGGPVAGAAALHGGPGGAAAAAHNGSCPGTAATPGGTGAAELHGGASCSYKPARGRPPTASKGRPQQRKMPAGTNPAGSTGTGCGAGARSGGSGGAAAREAGSRKARAKAAAPQPARSGPSGVDGARASGKRAASAAAPAAPSGQRRKSATPRQHLQHLAPDVPALPALQQYAERLRDGVGATAATPSLPGPQPVAPSPAPVMLAAPVVPPATPHGAIPSPAGQLAPCVKVEPATTAPTGGVGAGVSVDCDFSNDADDAEESAKRAAAQLRDVCTTLESLELGPKELRILRGRAQSYLGLLQDAVNSSRGVASDFQAAQVRTTAALAAAADLAPAEAWLDQIVVALRSLVVQIKTLRSPAYDEGQQNWMEGQVTMLKQAVAAAAPAPRA